MNNLFHYDLTVENQELRFKLAELKVALQMATEARRVLDLQVEQLQQQLRKAQARIEQLEAEPPKRRRQAAKDLQ